MSGFDLVTQRAARPPFQDTTNNSNVNVSEAAVWRAEPYLPFVWNVSGDGRDWSQGDGVDVPAHEQASSVQILRLKNGRLV